ncbi:hypothetical protein [Aureimonas leprariae]|uniref:Uncharacterized protein n=1 Tax=Plantimonas leprariae TaxID=2615207 RepID=A0A7V7TY91_9HYPH|nr:hypothetical protein [Aureimonas leprariae]KAB0682071.1 hypothetical protein F6X38_04535 [Aureimonas leprariae]
MSDTPFDQGVQARLNDLPTAACRYPQGSTMQRGWMNGWSERQVVERTHRSLAIDELNVEDLLHDPAPAAIAKLFRPTGDPDEG